MAYAAYPVSSNYSLCLNRLQSDPRLAAKYIKNNKLSGVRDKELMHHYLMLTPGEKSLLTKKLNAFFNSRAVKGEVCAEADPPKPQRLCNMQIINEFNSGVTGRGLIRPRTIAEVEKITSSLIKNCKNIKDAFYLLENLKRVVIRDGTSIRPWPFNICLLKCLDINSEESKEKMFHDAFYVVKVMESLENVRPDHTTCMNILTVCAECARFDEAEKLVLGKDGNPSLMEQWEIIPTICICSAFLKVCAKTGQYRVGYKFVFGSGHDNMQNRWPNAEPPIKPNPITCVNILTLCTECTRVDPGERFSVAKELVLGKDGQPSIMEQWKVTPNNIVCNAFLTVCVKTGQFHVGCNFLFGQGKNDIKITWKNVVHSIKPNFETCKILLILCIECTQAEAAERFDIAERLVLGKDGASSIMEQLGLVPDIAICNALLKVYAKTRQFRAGQKFLLGRGRDNMQNRWPNAVPPIKPIQATCVNFLYLCIQCTQIEPEERFAIAKQLVSEQMHYWGVAVNHFIRCLLAVVDPTRFSVLIKEGIEEGIYLENLGVYGDEFNLRCNKVCKLSKPLRNDVTVPLEFAKALFLHHRRNGVNIVRIRMESDTGQTLRDGFKAFLDDLKLNYCVPKFNPGIILLEADATLNYDNCVEFLTMCAELTQFKPAERFAIAEKFVNEQIALGLNADHVIHSLMAIIDPTRFSVLIEEGVKEGIYLPNLGIYKGELDFHVNKIFKMSNPGENDLMVPLEFAKALFLHHRRNRVNIVRIRTGADTGQNLRDEFKGFLDELKLASHVEPRDPGIILLEVKLNKSRT